MSPHFQGLDRAVAPPAATAKKMLEAINGRWWNVYIGGPESGGHGWTPDVVREYARNGIDRFMLTYVGQQAGGVLTREQGRKDARDALAIAKRFGYSGEFPLCLDVELSTFTSAPSKTVEYTKAWCATVREAGTRPGVYANPAPLQAMAKAKVPADFVWVASWVTTSASPHDPHQIKGMPSNLWGRPGQRAWQYAGIIRGKPCNVLGLNVDINVADLGCLAAPPNGAVPHEPKRIRALRKGDRGPLVVRATHRLSVLRSRKTGQPYLDGPRSRFDAETEVALKAFQSEHGLAASGRYGRESARALLTAVKRAKAAHNGSVPEVGATKLPALVREFRRLDAEADRAWQRLEAYGRQRLRALEREKERADGDSSLTAITASLERIEKQLATLVELERRELELESAQAGGEPEAGMSTALETGAVAATAEVGELVAVATPLATDTATGGGDGAGGSNGAGTTVPEEPRRTLAELTDRQLDRRIDVLDERLEKARKLRMARYARVEKALAELTGKTVVKPGKKAVKKPVKKPGKKPGKAPGKTPGERPADKIPQRPGVKALQVLLNRFSEKYLDGLAPLKIDGKKGPETDKRIRTVKYYLGYGGDERRSAAVPDAFLRRLRHPRSPRFSGPGMLTRAANRRRKQRAAAKRLTGGAIEGTPKQIIDRIALPIAQQCGINRTVADNDAANARHGPTNTGGVSDHQGPGHVAWAADISNGWQPTPEMDKLARALAKRFNIPWNGSGLVNASHGGYRYQLIYRTMLGGNHYNHVHFGVRDV